ncbi:Hypothetical predicted protein [Mytilus galloprovincialis]|uniref:Uncharacterized protein n=1 Tax=Mytilus galloprovincialis TaxID=29158 RepID=A0A8B6FG93_MYTGA|nr:Hypothetical predicted protein [Mytilus galloprovincialis]
MQDNLQAVTVHTSKRQSFLGLHHIGEKVHQYQRYLNDIENNEGAWEVEIKIKKNDDLEKILCELQSFRSFGEVEVSQTDLAINRETGVSRETQVETRNQFYIDKMTMHIETKREDNIKKNISDMVCLSGGRIIVVEYESQVNLLNDDGTRQKMLLITGKPHSVAQINKDTIAITYSYMEIIKIFNIENETVTKVIKVHNYCFGLSFSNESLAVGLNSNEIRIIDLEGKRIKSIQVQNESYLKFLVYSDNRIIYSDRGGYAVNCIDGSGKQIWHYKQDLSEPYGLSADTFGNIIVADCDSKTIIAISKDGNASKLLARNDDILYLP